SCHLLPPPLLYSLSLHDALPIFTLSLLVGWPLMGFIAGTLQGDVTGWRKDRHIRRTATVATLIWCAMFVARLAVQMPLYFAENRSEEHTSELQSRFDLVCRLLLV